MNQAELTLVKKLYKELMQQHKVALFVHEYPDFDALSSAMGLQTYLQMHKIDARIVNIEKVDKDFLKKFVEPIDVELIADDDFIKQAVGVVLDTANSARIFSQKQTLVKKLYRIDHHLKVETIGDLEWVNTNYSSTSEMVGWLIYLNNQKGLNQRICNFLYTGILADSGKFMYDLTKATTFSLVSKFYDYNFKKNQIQDLMFLKSWASFKKDLKLLKKVKVINNNVAYLILSQTKIRFYKLKANPVKVHLMNDFADFKIWITIIYNSEQNNWKGSIRSRDYNVNTIAKKFNGGGHVLASGFKLQNKKEIKQFLNYIKNLNLEELKINK